MDVFFECLTKGPGMRREKREKDKIQMERNGWNESTKKRFIMSDWMNNERMKNRDKMNTKRKKSFEYWK